MAVSQVLLTPWEMRMFLHGRYRRISSRSSGVVRIFDTADSGFEVSMSSSRRL